MSTETARTIYVTALRNTHALEQEALQAMERQVERIENYPEVKQALESHIAETKQQRERLEKALSALGESPSTLKETVMGFMGSAAALAHVPAADEILKNAFANSAVEGYEIAAYKSLIAIAEEAGDSASVPSFRQSLAEEEAMAEKVRQMIDALTRKYLSLAAQGSPADAKV